MGFPGGSVVKNPPANVGDVGSSPGSGRSPGEGNGNPLQYSCLENARDRGAWWATVQRAGHNSATKTTTKLIYSERSHTGQQSRKERNFSQSYGKVLCLGC